MQTTPVLVQTSLADAPTLENAVVPLPKRDHTPAPEPKRPDLLTVAKAQDAVLRDCESLARRWRRSGNPARRQDGRELQQLVTGQA